MKAEIAPPLLELDATYRVDEATGIHAYTVALIAELQDGYAGELVVLTRAGQVLSNPTVRSRTKTLRDHLRVRRGTIRWIPHQLRLPPPVGRSVVTIHDVIHLGHWTPLPKRLIFAVMLRSFRLANVRVIAVSHYTRSRLLGRGFDPASVAVCQSRLPGVEVSPAPPDRCTGGGFVYVGNLRAHKGVGSLTAGHIAALRNGLDANLHVVTSAGRDQVDHLRSSYPADLVQRLCVHHRAPDSERDWLIGHAIAVVAPSYEEGYGFALDESDRAGVPVIASLIPAHVENGADRDVVFVPPGDPARLAAAMVAAAAAPARRGHHPSTRQRSDACAVLETLVGT